MQRIISFFLPVGRITRLQFWLTMLVSITPQSLFLWSMLRTTGQVEQDNRQILEIVTSSIGTTVFFASFWIYFVAIINRLHDRDKSGWNLLWIFGPFIIQYLAINKKSLLIQYLGLETTEKFVWSLNIGVPIIATIAMIWLFFEAGFGPGMTGSNTYGRDPAT